MSGIVRIGISGWTYAPWRKVFYPDGLRQKDELEYAASKMTSIEINGSFYSLQRPESYQAWRERTPDGFVFAVKGGRFITHMKKLADVDAPLANFFASGPLALGEKLGPVLWQLPPTLGFDAERLESFFDRLKGAWGGMSMTGRWIDGIGDLPRARYFVPPRIGTTVTITIAALWLVPISVVVALFALIGTIAGSL